MSKPTIRRRIQWRLQARRHRTLTPPNMSELPWSRFAMDEQTGEIYDRRTWSRRAARRRFRREHDYGEPVMAKSAVLGSDNRLPQVGRGRAGLHTREAAK